MELIEVNRIDITPTIP